MSDKINKKELIQFVERIERIDEDAAALAADKKDLVRQIKSSGYDTKYIAKVVKARKMDADKLEEELELTKMYGNACGIQLTLF